MKAETVIKYLGEHLREVKVIADDEDVTWKHYLKFVIAIQTAVNSKTSRDETALGSDAKWLVQSLEKYKT